MFTNNQIQNAKKRIVTAAKTTKEYTRKGEGDVIRLHDGRILMIYMEFSGDGSDFATTRIVAKESSDRGATWTRHRVIDVTRPNDINIYSPNLIRRKNGHILLAFMRKHSMNPTRTTIYVQESIDEGETFESLSEIAPNEFYGLCNAVIKRLDSGRLLLPVTGTPPGEPNVNAATVFFSDDDGICWQKSADWIRLPMRGVMEPHVEQTSDGRVLMVMRSQLGSLFISESFDQAKTWSLPQPSALITPESCPEMVSIPQTGDLLMIWNNSAYDPSFASHYGKRSPLTCAVSTDQGKTWNHIKNIEDDPNRAFSNPGCRFIDDDLALVNYWTCEYLPDWRMQDVIDLRTAAIQTPWFYR